MIQHTLRFATSALFCVAACASRAAIVAPRAQVATVGAVAQAIAVTSSDDTSVPDASVVSASRTLADESPAPTL
jgi:hypothetical protein